MTGGVYKYIDVVGTSGKSIEDAIATAVTQASKSVRNIYGSRWPRRAARSRTARWWNTRCGCGWVSSSTSAFRSSS